MLRLLTPSGERPVSRDELESLGSAGAAEAAGRWAEGMTVVAFSAVAALAPPTSAELTHATFHASDGYAASIPLAQAMVDGVVCVPSASSGRQGVRLVVGDAGTACVNVKSVVAIELRRGPGKHTVDPDPHDNAFVPGWDRKVP